MPAGVKADPKSGLRVQVEASNALAHAVVDQEIAVEGPAYATQLTASKSSCRVGEVVFFRSLTLERFSLRPLGQAFRVQFALVDAQDQEMGVTQSRRVIAERFHLTENQVRQIEREGLDGQWPPL